MSGGVLVMSDWLKLYRDAGARRDYGMMHRREPGQNEIANTLVIRRLTFKQSDVVVDVGCGDGWLLANLPPVARRVGVVPSDDEVAALNERYAGGKIEFSNGSSASIPLPDGIANVIVCNSVLFQLPDMAELVSSLREFSRIAAPGATVFIGEMPVNHTPRASVRAYRLLKRVANNGLAEIMAAIRRHWPSAGSAQEASLTVPVDSKRPMHLPYLRVRTDQMCAIAKRAGFKIDAVERWDLTLDGVTYPHATDRYNYILKK